VVRYLRQGLIRTLRVLVPAIYVPAFLVGVAAALVDRWEKLNTIRTWAAVRGVDETSSSFVT
jgi:hypothetical protein